MGHAARSDSLQAEIPATGPPPVLRLRHQAFSHRVEVHVMESLSELSVMPHKTIPELVLPKGVVALALAVQAARGDIFHVLDQAGDREGGARPQERVPVVWHQHISAKRKSQPTAGFLKSRQDQWELCFRESRKRPAEIHGDEENSVAQPKPMHARHAANHSMVATVNWQYQLAVGLY